MTAAAGALDMVFTSLLSERVCETCGNNRGPVRPLICQRCYGGSRWFRPGGNGKPSVYAPTNAGWPPHDVPPRPTSRPVETALHLRAQLDQEERAPSPGLAWPAWTPEPLLGELRDAEQMALGAVDVGRHRCDPALVGAGEALAGELLALHVALTVPTVATLGLSLQAVHGLVGSLRGALRRAP